MNFHCDEAVSVDEEQGVTARRRAVYMETLDESSTVVRPFFAALVKLKTR